MTPCVYILLCSNGRFYVGSTTDLDLRLDAHFTGNGSNYTKRFPPVALMYVEDFSWIDDAYKRECQLHKWSHSKKQALIDGNMKQLHQLAACRNCSHYLFEGVKWN